MYRNPPLPSLFRRIRVSFFLGFGLFLLGALVQIVLDRAGVRGAIAYTDNLIVGLLAGFLVFAYEQRRHRAMLDRIRVIAAMNHHVRNALQAISFSPYAEQAKQIQLVQESTKRIQWALREILPGEAESDQETAGRHDSQGDALGNRSDVSPNR
jgi:hypothetical protein